MKQFFVLTLFPEMIEQTLSHSIMGRAQKGIFPLRRSIFVILR